jgi:hypothetical protein
MSDIIEALHFATSNETEAQVRTIVHVANEWCRVRLTKERMAVDVFGMLNAYTTQLGNNATRWHQWEELLQVYEGNMTLLES